MVVQPMVTYASQTVRQVALKSLKGHTFKSQLLAECLDVLKRLTLKCTLRWVLVYTGVEGNETADQLGNEGSDHYFIGPESFFGYNNSKCKLMLDEWILRRKKAHVETLPPNSLARRCLNYSSKKTQELLTLTNSELKTITSILTGHSTICTG
jgi:hypothetical protein